MSVSYNPINASTGGPTTNQAGIDLPPGPDRVSTMPVPFGDEDLINLPDGPDRVTTQLERFFPTLADYRNALDGGGAAGIYSPAQAQIDALAINAAIDNTALRSALAGGTELAPAGGSGGPTHIIETRGTNWTVVAVAGIAIYFLFKKGKK